MELTPDVLANVTFKEQWRGYSPDQVDEFLERVADGVAELRSRVLAAEQRAAQAEATGASGDQDEIRRTLVLAQRTAAAAVEEAKGDAGRIRAEAEATAAERLREAADEAASRLDEADRVTREQVAAAEARLVELEQEIARREQHELAELGARRSQLDADVAALVAFMSDSRTRLRQELRAQLDALDTVEAASPSPPEVGPNPPAADPVPEGRGGADPADESSDELEEEIHDERVDVDEGAVGDEEEADEDGSLPGLFDQAAGNNAALAGQAAGDGDDDLDDPDDPDDPVLQRARADLADALREAGVLLGAGEEPSDEADEEVPEWGDGPTDDEEWRAGTPHEDEDTGAVPAVPAEPVDAPKERAPVTIADDEEDDPFLAELRRAVTDTEPLGPREHQPSAEGPGFDEPDGGRFRLRRNR